MKLLNTVVLAAGGLEQSTQVGVSLEVVPTQGLLIVRARPRTTHIVSCTCNDGGGSSKHDGDYQILTKYKFNI